MSHAEIEKKLRDILVTDFDVPQDKIQADSHLRTTLSLDSLEVVDLIMLLQKDLGMRAPLESYRGIDTFAKLVEHVQAQLAGQAS